MLLTAREWACLYHDPRKKQPWIVRWFGECDPASGKQKRYSKSFRLKRDAEIDDLLSKTDAQMTPNANFDRNF